MLSIFKLKKKIDKLRAFKQKLMRLELKNIVNKLKKIKVEKIILFGSYVGKDISLSSDLDIIVVYQTPKKFLDRLDELYQLIQPKIGLDILAYTPAEFENLKDKNSFIKNALNNGRIIYEAG